MFSFKYLILITLLSGFATAFSLSHVLSSRRIGLHPDAGLGKPEYSVHKRLHLGPHERRLQAPSSWSNAKRLAAGYALKPPVRRSKDARGLASHSPSPSPCYHASATDSATPTGGSSSTSPSEAPSSSPSETPSATPSSSPSETPSETPSSTPSETPSSTPSSTPSETPSSTPSSTPSETPSSTPSQIPSETPSQTSSTPSATPTDPYTQGYLGCTGSSGFFTYVANTVNGYGEYAGTSNPASRLLVKMDLQAAQQGSVDIKIINGVALQSFPYFGAISGVVNTNYFLGPANYNYAYIGGTGQTAPGAVPATGLNIFTAVTGRVLAIESAIWQYDATTNVVTPVWVNPDGSTPPMHLFYDPATTAFVFTGNIAAYSSMFGSGFKECTLTFSPATSAPPPVVTPE